jgi:hypothetical protein
MRRNSRSDGRSAVAVAGSASATGCSACTSFMKPAITTGRRLHQDCPGSSKALVAVGKIPSGGFDPGLGGLIGRSLVDHGVDHGGAEVICSVVLPRPLHPAMTEPAADKAR